MCDMKVLPKAILVKQLIGKRKTMANKISRKEFSAVTQAAAGFSGNPINSMLDDHMEYGRA